jgi:hypothetical protein
LAIDFRLQKKIASFEERLANLLFVDENPILLAGRIRPIKTCSY